MILISDLENANFVLFPTFLQALKRADTVYAYHHTLVFKSTFVMKQRDTKILNGLSDKHNGALENI